MEELRTKIAGEKADIARQKLENMQDIPADKEGRKQIYELAANVMVHHFATSEVQINKEGFQVMGSGVIRNRLMKEDSFQKMINGYLKEKNMTPKKLVEKLSNGDAINRMVSINKKMVEQEKIRNKKQLAKTNLMKL